MTLTKRAHTELQADKKTTAVDDDATKWAENYVEDMSESQLLGLKERARKKYHPKGSL